MTHPLSKSQWNRGHFRMKKWESERHKTWGLPAEGLLLRTAPCWEEQENGEHVAGQWCSWIMTKNWDPCMECTAQWRQNLKSTAPSRGRS